MERTPLWPNRERVPRSTKNLGEDACHDLPTGRILPQTERKIPDDINEPKSVSAISGSKDHIETDRGRLMHVIEGMRQKSAQNSRGLGERRQQPLFGEQAIEEDCNRASPAIPFLPNLSLRPDITVSLV